MDQKKPTVSFSHAWNRPYLPAGGADKAYLLIEARGSGTVRVERAPINLSLVLDRSGSMTGDPLSFSKKACQFVVDQMNADDVLSLVTFDDEVVQCLVHFLARCMQNSRTTSTFWILQAATRSKSM
jgi:Ca-activated chloride channel homolog